MEIFPRTLQLLDRWKDLQSMAGAGWLKTTHMGFVASINGYFEAGFIRI